LPDNNIEGTFNISSSLPLTLIFTSCILVTISLLPSAAALVKNASPEVNALVDEGAFLNDLGNHTGAIQYYDKALAVDPNNVAALNNKGNALNSFPICTIRINFNCMKVAIMV
jgi:tetratricopeptide (TPR) repeat protein